MRNRARLVILCAIGALSPGLAGIAWGAQSVQILSRVDGVSATMNVKTEDNAGTRVDIQIPAVAVSPANLADAVDYKQIELPSADYLFASETAEDGKPAIPALSTMLAIADRAGVQLSVTYSGYDVIDDFELAPVQPSQMEASLAPVPFTKDEQAYNTDAFYPGDLASVSDPVIMRDIRMVTITMYPVQYNPAQKQLRIYRDLSVTMSQGGTAVNPLTIHHRYLSDGFYPLYKAMIANFDQLYSTAEVRRGGLVILSKPVFVDSLRALALWKHAKGYTVRVVPTTEVNPNGSPTAAQVFNYLKTAYQTWQVPPEYVMIVGDRDNYSSTGIPDYPYGGFASDHHYACVAGTDYIPDIFVARMSVDNMSEFRKVVSKIIKYELRPYMNDPQHWIRGLSCAHTGFESARLTTLWVRQILMRNGFVRVDTSFTSGVDPNLPGYFNRGVAYISYRGYAGSDGWWGPSFGTADLNALQSTQKLGVMASLVCGTGDFAAECFGEFWLRMGVSPDSLKGGPAFYGVSDHYTHTRWNNPIMIGYYAGIFNEDIYHFAAAAVRGKMQDWRTFPRYRGAGGYVEQYFHTYNMLGDPELELRTKIPIGIAVSHADSLPFGPNHLEVNVSDSMEAPISGAYVTLIKQTDSLEEVFSVGRTDESGRVTLSFEARSTGAMLLTVSGRDLYPFQANVQIVNSDIAVGFDSLTIDDDNVGHSYGDGNGLASPGETIELSIFLRNFGLNQTASSVTASLEPMDENLIEVFDGNRSYGDLVPGQSGSGDRPCVIHVGKHAQDGDVGRARQVVRDQNNDYWYSIIEIPIKAPKFIVNSVTLPGGNGRLDPGDTVQVVLRITNEGSIDAADVTGTITSDDDYSSVISSYGTFGNIPVDTTASNSGMPMIITASTEAFCGRNVNLVLHTATAAGSESAIPFYVRVDTARAHDPVGPDAYGYYIYDDVDTAYAMRPSYQWVEINSYLGGPGRRITFRDYDDDSRILSLPFDFVCYGEPRRALIVCTNGFVALDTFKMDSGGNFWANFFNWPIPDPGNAQGQISPFWDDLSYTGNYGVFTWYDSTNHQFIVEWSGMTHRNTGSTETFEMIISDPAYHPTLTGDSEILFFYNTITNNDADENYATVGFESWDELRGLEYTHDNYNDPGAASLVSHRVLRITTSTGRGGIRGHVDLDNGGFNENVRVSTSTGQQRLTARSGEYWIQNAPPGIVRVSAESYGYFPMTVDSVTVTVNQTAAPVDFNMTKCPIPSHLRASDTLGSSVDIAWSALDNPNLVGYSVYRCRWETGAFIKLNTDLVTDTLYTDSAVPDSAVYWYYVTASFAEDTSWTAESYPSNKDAGSLHHPVGIKGSQPSVPREFFLSQNYPNPFNPTTTISYGLPHDSQVKLEIFNIMGQKVRTLADGRQTAGYKSIIWDGRDGAGQTVASGVYFYRLDAGDRRLTKKMLMVK